MNLKHSLIILLLGIFIIACHKNNADFTQNTTGFIGFQKPNNFPNPVYNFTNNPITKAGFILGRSLFFESKLSKDNSISCGSCHIPSSAFTQHGHDVSHGIEDRLGTRNSPPIMNLAWNKAFMWGGGIFDLDLQPIVPITEHVEMDETLENVLQKLRATPKYMQLFKNAFGSSEINTTKVMKSLSQYMLMCVSSDSKYDQVIRKEHNANFSQMEKAGYQIFLNKCASCHPEPLFTDGTFRNNGLPASSIDDKGLYMSTLIETDAYKFKMPSLRNLKYTAPYMHDGRFLSLNAVLEHYNTGIHYSANLDPIFINTLNKGNFLNEDEKLSISAFLNTLNDENFVSNPLLSEQ